MFARLSGQFSNYCAVSNHYVPLAGETYGGSVADSRIENMPLGHEISMEAPHLQLDDFCSPEVFKAAQEALMAHTHLPKSPVKAEQQARQALKISPICPEAYNVLALCSGSYDQALKLYRRAEEVGTQVVPPGRLKRELDTNDLWLRACMRPYLRAMFGVGNTLRKLGRYSEALEQYERLICLSSKMHPMGTFTNWFAHLPELWFRVHGPQECLTRMFRAKKVRTECIEYQSAQVWWLYGMALAQFASGRVTSYKCLPEGSRDLSEPGGIWEGAWAGAAAAIATGNNSAVVEYLLEESPMPSNPLPRFMPDSGSHTQAALYVKMCGDMWRATPGALNFIKRVRNTQRLAMAVYNAHTENQQLDVPAMLRYIQGGLYADAAVTPSLYCGCTLLMSICALPASTYRNTPDAQVKLVRAMLGQGADAKIATPPMGLTALHKACYYAAGPEVVRLLLDAGCDPIESCDDFRCALSMAANQGNHREMDAILCHSPHLVSRTALAFRPAVGESWTSPVLELLLFTMLESSCLPCVAGGPKCQRCEREGGGHSPHCSFHTCVDVLVKHGLRNTPHISSYNKALLRFAPRNQKAGLRAVVQHFVEASLTATNSSAASQNGSARSGSGGSQASGAEAATAGRLATAAPPVKAPKRCYECGTTEGRLQKCAGCKSVYFCGRECQLKNWPAHKKDCKRLAAMQSASA